MTVPYSFEVPKDDDNWPRDSRGMHLGAFVAGIRRPLCYVNMRDELQSLGLQSLGLQSLGLQSLGLQSLGLQSLGLQSLGLQSLGLVNRDSKEKIKIVGWRYSH